MTGLQVSTNRFHSHRRGDGLAVGIVQSPPRWPLGFEVVTNLPKLAPPYAIWHLDPDSFAVRYRAGLDKLGAAWVLDTLTAIAEQHGDHRLSLLCFEDLRKPGEWCHRSLFAAWFGTATGLPVPELQHVPPPTGAGIALPKGTTMQPTMEEVEQELLCTWPPDQITDPMREEMFRLLADDQQ